jgi:hypothetical protein
MIENKAAPYYSFLFWWQMNYSDTAVDLCSVLVVYSYFRQLQGTHGHLSKPDDKMQNVVHEDHSYDRHFPEKTLPYQSTEPLISH